MSYLILSYHLNTVSMQLQYVFLVSLSQLTTQESINYFNTTYLRDHAHLSPVKFHLIFFLHQPSLTVM